MPGLTLRHAGEPALSHGHALVRWEAVDAQGAVRAGGSNVFTFAPDGRIESAIGFWAP
jgi:hypothetical protein